MAGRVKHAERSKRSFRENPIPVATFARHAAEVAQAKAVRNLAIQATEDLVAKASKKVIEGAEA